MDPLLCSILVKSQSHNQYVWINRLYINDEFGVSVHDRLQSWMKCCANRSSKIIRKTPGIGNLRFGASAMQYRNAAKDEIQSN